MTRFVNPYNFVPVSASEPLREEVSSDETLTGVIEYTLLTKSPVMIPNTSNDDIFGRKDAIEKDHKSYEFFSYEDLSAVQGGINGKKPSVPVIPGSEVRGMFRSNYEILTNSCLPFVDKEVLHKRTAEVYKAGILEKNGKEKYRLLEAQDCLLRTKGANSLVIDKDGWDKEAAKKSGDYSIYDRKCYIQSELHDGDEILCSITKRDRGKRIVDSLIGGQKGYVVLGEDGPCLEGKFKPQQKHCAHIFIPVESKVVAESITLEKLEAVLEKYEHYESYKNALKKFKNSGIGKRFPVYYSDLDNNGKIIYLSPACITREIYTNRMEDVLRRQGLHTSCADNNDPEKLCPACRLFGILGEHKESRVRAVSRVRFSDLKPAAGQTKELFNNVICLPELASPRLQNTEFYLKRPNENAVFWTYDYYIDKNGKVTLYTPEANGRKFYWHQFGTKRDSTSSNPEETERNITVRPLKEGVRFQGKMFFENISRDELNKLIYLLNAGEVGAEIEKKQHGYLIGTGKPIGYGSVAVHTDKIVLRKSILSEEEKSLSLQFTEGFDYSFPFGEENESVAWFSQYTAFDAVKDKIVTYPHKEKAEFDGTFPSFAWFSENHIVNTARKGFPPQYEVGKMANERKKMAFREYMEPLNPSMVSTGLVIDAALYQDEKRAFSTTYKDEEKVTGRVKKIGSNTGYLFIEVPGREDIYANRRAFPQDVFDSIQIGDEVKFVKGVSKDGRPCAKKAWKV